jgi:hypothetical protein
MTLHVILMPWFGEELDLLWALCTHAQHSLLSQKRDRTDIEQSKYCPLQHLEQSREVHKPLTTSHGIELA